MELCLCHVVKDNAPSRGVRWSTWMVVLEILHGKGICLLGSAGM